MKMKSYFSLVILLTILFALEAASSSSSSSSPNVILVVANKSLERKPGFGYVNFLFHPNNTLEVPEENKLQLAAQNYKQCLVACASNLTCFSINFGKQPIYFEGRGQAHYLCELLPTDKYNSSSTYQNSTIYNHYSIKSECNKSPCLHNFPCRPNYDNDTYECLCPRPQFEGKHCNDVDECTTGQHDCSVNAICINIISSFNCTCKDGYAGNGRSCEDVDECVTGQHDCSVNANCTNLIGSHKCTCKNGYAGNGRSCTDVDECDTGQHDCSVNAVCTNIIGSFSCLCQDGYVGNGRNCELKIVLPTSEILKDYGNDSYRAALETFMDQVPEDIVNSPWTRCWSGMNDGFDVKTTFHPQCDYKRPTVTLVRKNQYIWGGYTDKPWKSPGTPVYLYTYSSKSFIFSLYNIHGFSPQKFDQVRSLAICNNDNLGPTFGHSSGGKDLMIVSFASTTSSNYNIPYSYAVPPGCPYQQFCNFFTGIAGGYTIDDIEVFYKN